MSTKSIETEVVINNAIPTANTLYINYCGAITHNNVTALRSFLTQYINNPNFVQLYFVISSDGGSVNAGVELYNFLRSLSERFIITMHNIGQISSIANIVYLAGANRFASPQSMFLLHGVKQPIPQGAYSIHQLEEWVSSLKENQERLCQIIAYHTKLSKKSLEKLFIGGKAHNTEFALKNGIMTHATHEFILPKGAVFTTFNISNN